MDAAFEPVEYEDARRGWLRTFWCVESSELEKVAVGRVPLQHADFWYWFAPAESTPEGGGVGIGEPPSGAILAHVRGGFGIRGRLARCAVDRS